MLSKFSVLMMLLIAATASLVGISSIIYKPASVETQAQPQLTPHAGQILKKQQQAQQLQKSQPLPGTQGLVTQKQGESMAQVMADKQLLDRLFPQIIKRIDGNTLLQKIDGKLLAQKMLPYIQVNLGMGDNYGPLVKVAKKGLSTDTYHTAEARCPVGTRVMGGGGQIWPERAPPSGLFDYNAYDMADNNIVSLNIIPTNRLDVVAKMQTSGSILAYATCLAGEAEVSLKP